MTRLLTLSYLLAEGRGNGGGTHPSRASFSSWQLPPLAGGNTKGPPNLLPSEELNSIQTTPQEIKIANEYIPFQSQTTQHATDLLEFNLTLKERLYVSHRLLHVPQHLSSCCEYISEHHFWPSKLKKNKLKPQIN
jgi:hypothetical protein